MGQTIHFDKNEQTRKSKRKESNPFGLPWRLGALEDSDKTWHPWIFDCNGEPIDVESDTLEFIAKSVNVAAGAVNDTEDTVS